MFSFFIEKQALFNKPIGSTKVGVTLLELDSKSLNGSQG
jgi:hypothetical protein